LNGKKPPAYAEPLELCWRGNGAKIGEEKTLIELPYYVPNE
jgi:hypothetical protein